MRKSIYILISFLIISSSVFSQIKHENYYQESIINSSYPKNLFSIDSLVQINDSNNFLVKKKINDTDYILVVSWKQNVNYYYNDSITGFYNTGNYDLWVTVAPELLNKYKDFDKNIDVNLRLKQIFGLPPYSTYSYFVEFWVNPRDLFRPCPDKEIFDSKCDFCFPEKTDQQHIDWINENRINRYYNCEDNNNYPWTQLGYTYDWSPENKYHIGLSEFVIKKNSNIIVKDIKSTLDYFNTSYYNND